MRGWPQVIGKKTPEVIEHIKALMKEDTAGDPMTALKWTRKTTQKIADELGKLGIEISPNTVAKLLKELGFSLRVNHKKKSKGSPKERNQQFKLIAEHRENFCSQSQPIISIDAKKKELVGNFKNAGSTWTQEAIKVNDHDFRVDAKGKAVPYGIYDVQENRGMVVVGKSFDTSEFAVDAVATWWRKEGSQRYANAKELLILADSGGSNGHRRRAWKHGLQHKICNPYGIQVRVAHYPRGASKWNPIEHRLFSAISRNWAGQPLISWETVLKYIRTTTSSTGLEVKAVFNRKKYEKGVKISDDDMDLLNLQRDHILPQWNYLIRPQ